ncbi:hypothetical protein [Nocardia sp. NPDC049707]|uniref:hypothetical protein n=1 Tax=Nocardia sp. NPDC049707 TaxID=3154735 RepID=UPI00343973B1
MLGCVAGGSVGMPALAADRSVCAAPGPPRASRGAAAAMIVVGVQVVVASAIQFFSS